MPDLDLRDLPLVRYRSTLSRIGTPVPGDRSRTPAGMLTACPLLFADTRFDDLDGRCGWLSREW